MANCDICGKKLGVLSGFSASAFVNSENCSITFCDSCAHLVEAIKAGDDASYYKATSFAHVLKNPQTLAILDAFYNKAKEKEAQQAAEERARQEEENIRRQKSAAELAEQVAKLKFSGADGYYEYKVVKLMDNVVAGCLNADQLMTTLNNLGLEGWRLVTAYSNELGKNALAIAGLGVNATADEHILIFERFQKI